MTRYDRLAALDSSFLHLERLETPMHVGAVSIFEGGPFFDDTGRFRLADVREATEERLALIPRFRKRLMGVPLAQGRPIWVDDDHFDISYHVRLTAVPSPGTREQLLALTRRVQAQLLDRSRPLWELWFVEGLEGGKVALIQKTHHALVDGVSGVDVATVLLDFVPEPVPPAPHDWFADPSPSRGQLLADTLWERGTQPAEIVRSVRSALKVPRHAAASTARMARSLGSLAGSGVVAPRTSLNRSVGRHRRIETVRVGLEDVKAIRRALGGTVNDVILAGVAGALRDLLVARGEGVDGLVLKAMCPVSVRDESQHMQLGNRVSSMFVPLPIGLTEPAERLEAVRAATSDLKEREQAVGAALLVDLSEYAAPTLLDLAARLVHRQPFVNLVVTNVPGPQVPLYCLGARMLEAYPLVPLSANMSIGVAILSYCGQLHFGLVGDRDAAADLAVFAGALEDAFAALHKVATEPD